MLTYRLIYIATAIAFLTCPSWAKAQSSQFIGQNSSTPISQDDGRFLNFDNLVSVNFLKDSTQIYNVEEDETLALYQSKSFVYDAQGVEQYHVVKRVIDSKWINESLVENTFNYDDLLSEQVTFRWDISTESWISTSMLQYRYNYFNLQVEVVEMKMEPSGWTNAERTTFSYSPEHLVEVETVYSWLDTDMGWMANSRLLFTYNENDGIEEEITQEWNESDEIWENTLSRQFDYNNDGNIKSSTRSVWKVGLGWVTTSVLDLQYNEKGQLEGAERFYIESNETSTPQHSEIAKYSDEGYLGETTQSEWDEETNTWEVYKKEIHFWSEHYNGQLVQNNRDIDCQFANPYLLGLPWYCDNLKDNIMYTVEVFDMWGRSFYKGQFSNKSTFRLSGNIPPGLYNVVIQGGLDRHTEKVLIRN